MKTYQGTLSVNMTSCAAAVDKIVFDYVDDVLSPVHLQDVRAVCGWVGDNLFWWEWLLHLLQQPALAQPLSVCLQAPGPGLGPAP